jgi:hypothetical protein
MKNTLLSTNGMRGARSFLYIITTTITLLFMSSGASAYQIGVYYFPGWADAIGAPFHPPWDKIKTYTEREPYLSWYKEGDTAVAVQHINWAIKYGIDFFVYDWYWDGSKPYLEHALKAFFRCSNANKLKFCLLWANHSEVPSSLDQFTSMIEYWIKNYFNKPNYLTIDGKPVVFIFAPQQLRDNISKFGKTTKDLFSLARSSANAKGLKGIYFVGSSPAHPWWINDFLPNNSYDAISTYNYHNRSFRGFYTDTIPPAVDYDQLRQGYNSQWSWIVEHSTLPYIVPISAGWDKRPWGSISPSDNCHSTPESFASMLSDAKAMMDNYPDKTLKMGVICAWNEFGEGSYIEPTKKWKFSYLEAIKRVFK